MGTTPHMNAQEQRIIDAIKERPLCHRELAPIMGMVRSGLMKYIDRMLNESPRRIFIAGYVGCSTGGYPRPLLAAGNQPDAEYVPKRPSMPKKGIDRAAKRTAQIVKAMEQPGSAREICQRAHMSVERLHEYFKAFRAAGEIKIHIKEWRREKNVRSTMHIPVYALGDQPDAKRPKPQTRKQRYKIERSTPERIKRHAEGKAHGLLMKKLKNKPASPFAALGV